MLNSSKLHFHHKYEVGSVYDFRNLTYNLVGYFVQNVAYVTCGFHCNVTIVNNNTGGTQLSIKVRHIIQRKCR